MEAAKFIRIMELRRKINSELGVVAKNTEACVSGSNRLAGELALKASERLAASLNEMLEELK